MSSNVIKFDDGAAYERYMGRWSQLAGQVFLDWLKPQPGSRWLDVGCGNGAFTELIIDRCSPAGVHGVDPAEGQLAFARTRPAARMASFSLGDAMALPFADRSFDIAVMPLVIFFVPNPLAGVAEMRRVTAPGGLVSAYAWDMYGGGFPYHPLQAQLRELGVSVPSPPSPEASRLDTLRELWALAGLEAIETTQIVVQRTFNSFDDYWSTVLGGPSVAATLAALSADDIATLQAALRRCLPAAAADGSITCSARANAVKGRVPS